LERGKAISLWKFANEPTLHKVKKLCRENSRR
jgi:hypothetical protein